MRKSVISVLSTAVGAGVGAIAIKKKMEPKINNALGYSKKHLALYVMMNDWVKIKQEGKNLKDYFEKHNYKNIAIYGMSYAGETLVNELRNTGINVKYGIDKNANRIYSTVEVVTMDDELEAVDAIVVTAITYFDEIEDALCEKIDCPIISLEDVLCEMQ